MLRHDDTSNIFVKFLMQDKDFEATLKGCDDLVQLNNFIKCLEQMDESPGSTQALKLSIEKWKSIFFQRYGKRKNLEEKNSLANLFESFHHALPSKKYQELIQETTLLEEVSTRSAAYEYTKEINLYIHNLANYPPINVFLFYMNLCIEAEEAEDEEIAIPSRALFVAVFNEYLFQTILLHAECYAQINRDFTSKNLQQDDFITYLMVELAKEQFIIPQVIGDLYPGAHAHERLKHLPLEPPRFDDNPFIINEFELRDLIKGFSPQSNLITAPFSAQVIAPAQSSASAGVNLSAVASTPSLSPLDNALQSPIEAQTPPSLKEKLKSVLRETYDIESTSQRYFLAYFLGLPQKLVPGSTLSTVLFYLESCLTPVTIPLNFFVSTLKLVTEVLPKSLQVLAEHTAIHSTHATFFLGLSKIPAGLYVLGRAITSPLKSMQAAVSFGNVMGEKYGKAVKYGVTGGALMLSAVISLGALILIAAALPVIVLGILAKFAPAAVIKATSAFLTIEKGFSVTHVGIAGGVLAHQAGLSSCLVGPSLTGVGTRGIYQSMKEKGGGFKKPTPAAAIEVDYQTSTLLHSGLTDSVAPINGNNYRAPSQR